MNDDISPHDLPPNLFDELYDPVNNCWKHHGAILNEGQVHLLIPVLKRAGIEIRTDGYTEEEDNIIMRNWNNMKHELGYTEGEDAKMYVGFGKTTCKADVVECLKRARQCRFNQRLCEGLNHRLLKSVRRRFSRLFEVDKVEAPKKIILTKKNDRRVTENGKYCKMSEDDLKQIWEAMKKTEGGNVRSAVALSLRDSMGSQWTSTSIENMTVRFQKLKREGLECDKWIPLYKNLLKLFMKSESKSESDLIELFEDEEYDWKGNVPWLSVSLTVGYLKKYVIKAWKVIIVKIRSVIRKLRDNGRAFVVFRLIENVVHEDKFDEWKKQLEKAKGEEVSEGDARRLYEDVLIYEEENLVKIQRRRNGGSAAEFHDIFHFKNGELVKILLTQKELGIRKSAGPDDIIPTDNDDEDDDGPLQDPVWLDNDEKKFEMKREDTVKGHDEDTQVVNEEYIATVNGTIVEENRDRKRRLKKEELETEDPSTSVVASPERKRNKHENDERKDYCEKRDVDNDEEGSSPKRITNEDLVKVEDEGRKEQDQPCKKKKKKKKKRLNEEMFDE